jgi:hypothetical protein
LHLHLGDRERHGPFAADAALEALGTEGLFLFIVVVASLWDPQVHLTLGGISFLHRFGSTLNHDVHLHVYVTDGVVMPAAYEAGCDTPHRKRRYAGRGCDPQACGQQEEAAKPRPSSRYRECE